MDFGFGCWVMTFDSWIWILMVDALGFWMLDVGIGLWITESAHIVVAPNR